jgi:hypothetical protein
MDYETCRSFFFAEPAADTPTPTPFASPSPARRLRDAIEPLACQAIWSKEVADRYVELGLDDWFAAYIWQRTAAMGTPPTLAVTGLGVFSPDAVGPLYERAVAVIPRAEVVRARQEGAGRTVRRLLGDIDADATRVVTGLRRGIDAAHATARPMFSGLSAEWWPEDSSHSSCTRATCCASTAATRTWPSAPSPGSTRSR